MQFAYAKEMAEELAGEGVRDCVLTIPAWFGHGERMAVLDGLELAGLRSIALVNDGTAGMSLSPFLWTSWQIDYITENGS